MTTKVEAQQATASPTPRRRRRPRGKPLPAGGAEGHIDGAPRRRSPAVPAAPATREAAAVAAMTPIPEAFPRLWALLGETQAEMERGTDALGDELSRLWRRLRAGEGYGGSGDGGGSGSGATVGVAAAGRQQGGRGGTAGPGSGVVAGAPVSSPQLPPEAADALLAGLGRLQVDMEAEALSFQRRKADLMRKVGALGRRSAGGGRGGREEKMRDEVLELEDEAESMRAAVAAAHARLLGRVREVGGGLMVGVFSGPLLCPCFVAPELCYGRECGAGLVCTWCYHDGTHGRRLTTNVGRTAVFTCLSPRFIHNFARVLATTTTTTKKRDPVYKT